MTGDDGTRPGTVDANAASGSLTFDVAIADDADLDALEQALLRARASELSEWRRRETRLVTGYGDDTTRTSLSEEGARARRRWTMLDRLLSALREARKPSR